MRRSQLPVTALPLWAKLNDVVFYDICVKESGSKGFGFAAERTLSSGAGNLDIPTVLHVPKDLILSAEAVEEHAKVDKEFRELLNAAGGKSTRGDIMLFLLLQITITSPDCPHIVGVSNPWTEYVRMLPSSVPTPTCWSEQERALLIGTSLESAVSAKLAVLLREFEALREKTIGLSWCQKVWWKDDTLNLNDWTLLDSWYRSRCLELPVLGESMVPCLDMANHTAYPNAYYERTSNGDVVLILKPDQTIPPGEAITISYGATKSAAEMIFTYGFLDETNSKKMMVLNMHPLPGDPLGRAKLAAFKGTPTVHISAEEGGVSWSSPFLYFMLLNEEDGLDFKVLQETDGTQGQLQVFWQGNDVTDATQNFQQHIVGHPLHDVFGLRAVALLQELLGEQIELLCASDEEAADLRSNIMDPVDETLWIEASRLRAFEARILQEVYEELESQKSTLIASPAVVEYLGSMGGVSSGTFPEEDSLANEDYS